MVPCAWSSRDAAQKILERMHTTYIKSVVGTKKCESSCKCEIADGCRQWGEDQIRTIL